MHVEGKPSMAVNLKIDDNITVLGDPTPSRLNNPSKIFMFSMIVALIVILSRGKISKAYSGL